MRSRRVIWRAIRRAIRVMAIQTWTGMLASDAPCFHRFRPCPCPCPSLDPQPSPCPHPCPHPCPNPCSRRLQPLLSFPCACIVAFGARPRLRTPRTHHACRFANVHTRNVSKKSRQTRVTTGGVDVGRAVGRGLARAGMKLGESWDEAGGKLGRGWNVPTRVKGRRTVAGRSPNGRRMLPKRVFCACRVG